MGLSHPALKSAECQRTSGWLGVSWSTLSSLVLPGLIAGWSCSQISAQAIMLAQDRSAVTCSWSHAGPPRWCTTRCPVSSGWSSSACTAMCGSCGNPVATSRAVPQGESTGPGLACPDLHFYPLGLELRLPRRSGALVIRGHQSHRRRRVWPGTQGLGTRHIRVRLSVLAFREYVVEDVHEGCRRVVRRPPRWGG